MGVLLCIVMTLDLYCYQMDGHCIAIIGHDVSSGIIINHWVGRRVIERRWQYTWCAQLLALLVNMVHSTSTPTITSHWPSNSNHPPLTKQQQYIYLIISTDFDGHYSSISYTHKQIKIKMKFLLISATLLSANVYAREAPQLRGPVLVSSNYIYCMCVLVCWFDIYMICSKSNPFFIIYYYIFPSSISKMKTDW